MSLRLKQDLFAPFFEQQGYLLLDGALATELEKRGADLHDPLWSARVLLENPALIRQVHSDYFEAGADVVITASYQASFAGLQERGLSWGEAADLIQRSVQLAVEARDQYVREQNPPRKPLVAASVGPYGAYMHNGSEYTGDYGLSVSELMDWHRPRFQLLATSGADLLACETIPSHAEGEALVRLLAETPETPAWLSFSCRNGDEVSHGEPFAACVALANRHEQAVAVGVNCTAPRHITSLLKHAATITDKPLLAYPNSGEEWDSVARCWLPDTGDRGFHQAASQWYQAGARLIGGCCRTGPAEIRKIDAVLAAQSPGGKN